MYRQEYRSIADDLQSIRRITLQEIQEVLQRYPISMSTTVGVGPLTELKTADQSA
jgi:predicted Zn-dependent peptidase